MFAVLIFVKLKNLRLNYFIIEILSVFWSYLNSLEKLLQGFRRRHSCGRWLTTDERCVRQERSGNDTNRLRRLARRGVATGLALENARRVSQSPVIPNWRVWWDNKICWLCPLTSWILLTFDCRQSAEAAPQVANSRLYRNRSKKAWERFGRCGRTPGSKIPSLSTLLFYQMNKSTEKLKRSLL